MQYDITSRDGTYYGAWTGQSPAHALAALHRHAGYAVRVVRGAIRFTESAPRELLGDVDDWTITAKIGG